MAHTRTNFDLQEQWPDILNAWDPDLNVFSADDYPPLFTDNPDPFDFLSKDVETTIAPDPSNSGHSSVLDPAIALQATDSTTQIDGSMIIPGNDDTSQCNMELLLQRLHRETQKMNKSIEIIVKEQHEYRMYGKPHFRETYLM